MKATTHESPFQEAAHLNRVEKAELSDLRKSILRHMVECADDQGRVEGVSVYALSRITGSLPPAVHAAIRGLIRTGWLTLLSSGVSNGRTNTYALTGEGGCDR